MALTCGAWADAVRWSEQDTVQTLSSAIGRSVGIVKHAIRLADGANLGCVGAEGQIDTRVLADAAEDLK